MKHTAEEVPLRNGAKALLVRVPGSEVVSFSVNFLAGFAFADREKYELPHVMEHLMFTNNSFPKPRQFHKEIEKNGAYSNAYTSDLSLEYEYECAKFEADRIANLIALQISEPYFSPKELATEVGNVREELTEIMSDHRRYVNEWLHSEAHGLPSMRTRVDQLPAITADDLYKHYEHTHTGANMRILIVGDVDFDALLKKLDVNIQRGQRLKIPVISPQHLEEPLTAQQPTDQIYYSIFSNLKRKMEYKELVTARIPVSLLADGFTSKLFGLARELGLIYAMGMHAFSGNYDTAWLMSGFVSPKNSRRFFRLVQGEIDKVQRGLFKESEFEATKTLLLGERALRYQRVSNLASYYSSYFEFDDYEAFDNYNNYVKKATKQEAVDAFNQLFADQVWGSCFIGDVTKRRARELRSVLAPLWEK